MRHLALVIVTLGCATATEQDVLTTKADSGMVDSRPVDTGAVGDTAITSCEGKTGATCKPGDKRTAACGNCGTTTDTCDLETCTWLPGKCTGEGPCAEGDIDESDCAVSGEKKRRTCSKTCMWSEYGACGVLNPWKAIATPPAGFEGRYDHSAVWTGSEMIVFGGASAAATKKDGAAYDPKTNSWRLLAAAPAHFSKGRKQHVAVWTGSKMIIWGGLDTDNYYATTNAAYDPKTDTWSDVKTVAIAGRSGPSSAWTGSEMLIWGGGVNDGAAYDPTTDTWTLIPASPLSVRSGQQAVWNGTQLVVWSGCPGGVICSNDGATYDPKTKTWTKMPNAPTDMDGRYEAVAIADGTAAIFWGGYGGTDIANLYKRSGARWDATAGWKSMATADGVIGPSGGRQLALSWLSAGKLYVFGGMGGGPTAENGGGIYDLATSKWSALPLKDAPLGRAWATVVWTGADAIVWGGTQQRGVATAILRDGATYRP